MINAIPIPPEIPFGYEEILIVFATTDEVKQNTQTCIYATTPFTDALKAMPISKRMAIIKKLLYAIEQMLLESSMTPGEVNVRDISKEV